MLKNCETCKYTGVKEADEPCLTCLVHHHVFGEYPNWKQKMPPIKTQLYEALAVCTELAEEIAELKRGIFVTDPATYSPDFTVKALGDGNGTGTTDFELSPTQRTK